MRNSSQSLEGSKFRLSEEFCDICEVTSKKQINQCAYCQRRVCSKCIHDDSRCQLCELGQTKYKNPLARHKKYIQDQKQLLQDIQDKKRNIQEEIEYVQTAQIYSNSYKVDVQIIESITLKLDKIQALNEQQQQLKRELDLEFQKYKDHQTIQQRKQKEIDTFSTRINNLKQEIEQKRETQKIKFQHLQNLENQRKPRKKQPRDEKNQSQSTKLNKNNSTIITQGSHYRNENLRSTQQGMSKDMTRGNKDSMTNDASYCGKGKCFIF